MILVTWVDGSTRRCAEIFWNQLNEWYESTEVSRNVLRLVQLAIHHDARHPPARLFGKVWDGEREYTWHIVPPTIIPFTSSMSSDPNKPPVT